MEGPLGMTECSVHVGSCGIEDSCNVRANWRRINDVVADALRGVSLAQMLSPQFIPTSGKPSSGRAIPARLTASCGKTPMSVDNAEIIAPHGRRYSAGARKSAVEGKRRAVR